MNIIKSIQNLPEDIQGLIYTYTEEYYRQVCANKKFKKLASPTNTLFPSSIFQERITYRQVLSQWNAMRRKKNIDDENRQYIKHDIRPSLQQCAASNNYSEKIYPRYYNNLPILGIDNFQHLLSYSIRLLLAYDHNVVLFVKPSHKQILMDALDWRLKEHNLPESMKYEYITFDIDIYSKAKIIVTTHNDHQNIREFIAYCKFSNIYVMNYIRSSVNDEGSGCGIYGIKAIEI